MTVTTRLRASIDAAMGAVLGLVKTMTRREGLTLNARIEIAWTGGVREAVWGLALSAAPREGAVIALCRVSTGASRRSLIVQDSLPPQDGDLSYHRGYVVTITSRYWNRVIDDLSGRSGETGIAVLHTHPGRGNPVWSADDDNADRELAAFLFGEGFLKGSAPLVSIVVSEDQLRARELRWTRDAGVTMHVVTRYRTLSRSHFEFRRTAEAGPEAYQPPSWADRSVRVFGRDGQRLLAEVHVAFVGTGGVGSITAEDSARMGFGRMSLWDPDVIKTVNINRSGSFTFSDAQRRAGKAETLAAMIGRVALVREVWVWWRKADVRHSDELARLLDADVISLAVDDVRVRNFVNAVAYAHFIPVLDGANVIRSTAEDDVTADAATVEAGGARVSVLVPGGPCLWCSGHITSRKLSLAYRTEAEVAADRARGYVEHLGPEHAPSVMPMNAMTAALVELRLQDLLYGLSKRPVSEVYYDLVGGTLDELPRDRVAGCPHCELAEGLGDAAELPHSDH